MEREKMIEELAKIVGNDNVMSSETDLLLYGYDASLFKGKRVRFYDAKMSPSAIEKQPGEIVFLEEGVLQIAGKGGIIRIGKLRVDKGEKIGPFEFEQAVNVKVGDRFGD